MRKRLRHMRKRKVACVNANVTCGNVCVACVNAYVTCVTVYVAFKGLQQKCTIYPDDDLNVVSFVICCEVANNLN